jgi:hypothetical protein
MRIGSNIDHGHFVIDRTGIYNYTLTTSCGNDFGISFGPGAPLLGTAPYASVLSDGAKLPPSGSIVLGVPGEWIGSPLQRTYVTPEAPNAIAGFFGAIHPPVPTCAVKDCTWSMTLQHIGS